VITEHLNPSKNYKAVVFYRDCGATTEKSIQISILQKDKNLQDDKHGNILTCKMDSGITIPMTIDEILKVDWISDTELIVFLNPGLETFEKNETFKKINVKYAPLISKPTYNINVSMIKTRYQKYSTSGVMPHTTSKDFCKPDSIGFFGSYCLVDSLLMRPIGDLDVFNKGNATSWRYDNQDDIFISLRNYQGDLTFFNGIRVGLSQDSLIKKIDSYFHYKKGSTVHVDIDKYYLDCQIKNDSISSITIRYNCKDE
jgi:hypothetical protein